MNEEKYTEEITKYLIYIDPEFKNEIIKKTKELISTDNN
jgi:16S rRNA G966 N2-methylase RsmD